MEEANAPFIDVEKIIESKNTTMAKLLPNFILNYLKRIIHEDEINTFIRTNGHLKNHECISQHKTYEVYTSCKSSYKQSTRIRREN